MEYFGISTHNLKNIDFCIQNGSIVLLKGTSGCGKSSLAIDTIYQISEDELAQLTNFGLARGTYTLDGYRGIKPAVCLRQENYNQNPRSTIGTYFGLNRPFQNIFSYLNNKEHTFFQFNNLDSACPRCHGLGTTPVPDIYYFTDFLAKLSSKSFKMWRNTDSEFYAVLFDFFCEEHKIPQDVSFNDLSEAQRELILSGESHDKYTVRYRCNGKKRTRTGKYRGPLLFLQDLLDKPSMSPNEKKYFIDEECPLCHGSRFSQSVDEFKFYSKSISQLYTMEFSDLSEFLKKVLRKTRDRYVSQQLNFIISFLNAALQIKLDYLNLNRSIPSLSGGELQRLSLAKACVVQFNDFLYVMDEPTSGLHPSEWRMVREMFLEIQKRNNSLLLIEHSSALDSIANEIIYLGPGSGVNGGKIVDPDSIEEAAKLERVFFPQKSTIEIKNQTYNNVVIENLVLPAGTITGICGVSGSGKTSFAKKILPRYIKNATYISQEPIRGNSFSIVATALGLLGDIEKYFSKETKKDIKYFWYSTEGVGQCPTCKGTGVITEKSIGWLSENECPTCRGKRFSDRTLAIRLAGLNIFEFLSQDIDTIISMLPENSPIVQKLIVPQSLGLGYLNLFQKTDTLSGGEAQRIKIAAAMIKHKQPSVYILDEPFRGVDLINTNKILQFLFNQVENGNSIYIIEHNPYVLAHCSYLLEFGPSSGKHGGRVIFTGTVEKALNSAQSQIAKYIREFV